MGKVADFFLGKKCYRCGTRTHNKFEDLYVCEKCELKIKIEREGTRTCMICNTKMKKKLIETIIIDKCPKCKGIWLDGGELKKIQEISQEEGESEGHSNGMCTGLVIGMIID